MDVGTGDTLSSDGVVETHGNASLLEEVGAEPMGLPEMGRHPGYHLGFSE